MKKTVYAVALAVLGLGASTSSWAQRQCASMEVLDRQLAADPTLAQRLRAIETQTQQFAANPTAQRGTALVGTIPVVVHVVYSNAAENISDAQIQSQIDVLNEDFRKLNADAGNTPAAFAGLVADVGLQFVLAKRDPSGNATNGIQRKSSTRTTWGTNDAVKKSSSGGLDAWPASQYLNLWVCNIGSSILGYAQFPGGPASTDGVVITTTGFGRGGSARAPFDLGRTATHEVGHWLNLRHIWGDANCGNDLVADTPTQQTDNGGCPSFPKVTCSNGPNGDMFMNYMDYTNDACMYMFSNGQSSRMNALFASGGSRASLLTSLGGTAPGGGGGGTPQPVAYCASKGNSQADEWVDLVRLGSINRTSGNDGGYFNGSGTSTSIAAGSSQTISYSAAFSGQAYTENWKIYIDYNRDGDFTDSGELVASRASSNSATLSSTFTVPSSARSGSTRLRVVMSYSSSATSCGTYSYGETEDYAVNITGGAAIAADAGTASTVRLGTTEYGLYPNPATSVLRITVPADRDAAAVAVRVYDVAGNEQRQLRYSAAESQLDVSGLSKGVYLLTITDGAQVSHQRFVKE